MPKGEIPVFWKFSIGGMAGILASLITHPLNTIKTCLQLAGRTKGAKPLSIPEINRRIYTYHGMTGFYKGLTANIMRQCTYTSMRIGFYTWGLDAFKDEHGNAPSASFKVLLGIWAGAVGAFAGAPPDIAMVRTSADACVSKAEGKKYTHVFQCCRRIISEEGVHVLFRGMVLNIFKGIIHNTVQLTSYFQLKQMLLAVDFKDDINLHLICSLVSSVAVTLSTIPVDFIKTRMQTMRVEGGKKEYKHAGDAIFKLVRKDGILVLWKGTIPFYVKNGPHTVLTFIFLEQLNRLYYYYLNL